MSLFNARPGIDDDDFPQLTASLAEANIHALLSSVASSYVRLLKKTVMPVMELPKEFGVRDMQILATLYESARPLTSTDIFKRTGLDPATVTRSTKNLIRSEYIYASENEVDSRSRFLHLTETGLAIAKTYNAACQKLFASDDLTINAPSLEKLQSLERTLKSLQSRIKILSLKSF